MRKKTLFCLISLLSLSLLSSISQNTTLRASALSINVTDASESTVRSYYGSLSGLASTERNGDNLLKNLKPILKNGHVSTSYTGVWNWSKITERDWTLSPLTTNELANYSYTNDDPFVKLLYRNDNGTATAAKHSDEHGQVIDREHVWSKSLGNFDENAPAGTDVHHLILGDSKNNQSGHSNYPYGNVDPDNYTPIDSFYNVDNPTNVGNYTGKRGEITYQGKTFTVYEPQDADKGDIARAMFYMAARYSSYTSQGDPYLKLTDNGSIIDSVTSSASVPGNGGLLSTLLEWHTLDPVDDFEIHRNNLIYNNFQYNRNPFIDYPSWVDSVWGSKTPASPSTDDVTQYGEQTSLAPTSINLTPSSITIGVSETSTLTVNVVPLNASKTVTWSSGNPGIASVSNGVVTGVSAGTTTITATSTLDNQIVGSATIAVSEGYVKTLSSLSATGFLSSVKFLADYPTDDIVVTATYDDSSTSNVTSSAIIVAPDTSIIGSQTLTIQYSENGVTKYANQTVKVTNNGVVIGDVPRPATELFFSEYIEGGSNNKALEIYNGTGNPIDLSAYSLKQYNNGGTTTIYNLALSGTLNNNDTYVIANSSATTAFTNVADVTTSASLMGFNGNDAVALLKGTEIIDLLGILGDSSNYAINSTYVRKSSVYQPTATWNTNEWTVYAQDTSSYLGSHTMSATTPGISASTQADAWARYFLDMTSTYCEDEMGNELLGTAWNELASEYGFMDDSTKLLYRTTQSNPDAQGVAGAKARYYYLVTKYTSLKTGDGNFLKDENDSVIFAAFQDISVEITQSNNLNGLLFVSLFGIVSIGFYFVAKRKIA